MISTEKNIILFLGKITQKHIDGVRDLEKYLDRKFRIGLLSPNKKTQLIDETNPEILNQIDVLVKANLKRIDFVEKALQPYKNEIVAILSKFENMMPLYGRLSLLFPYLKNPTPQSLVVANDKIEMRKAFRKYTPKSIPRFIIVHDDSATTIKKIESTIKFPCIIKPASLSKSQLVINCYYREELEKTLKIAFKKVRTLYKNNRVEHEPKLLVEQLIEGNLYSLDVYINSRGQLYYTPAIEIKTGKDIGHDDFFMYSQITPGNLDGEDLLVAKRIVADGIYALGLRSCTAHAEFYRTKKGFKLVEIASRTGGFRDQLLADAFGIRHHMNDILIRLGKKPNLKHLRKKHTAFLKFWPNSRGVLQSIKGFKKNSEQSFVISAKQQKKPGEIVGLSKYGHSYICSFNIMGADRSELLGNIRKIEKNLTFIIKPIGKKN